MRFKVFLIISLFGVVNAHVQEECLFGQTFVFNGAYDAVMGSDQGLTNFSGKQILFVRGANQFHNMVLKNARPVVVKVFSKQAPPTVDFFHEVAGELSKKVNCVAMDLSVDENFGIIRQIMMRLGVRSLKLPFFLLFDRSELILPIRVLPPIYHFTAPARKEEIKREFIDYIEKRLLKDYNAVSRSKVRSSQKLSTLDKIEKLSEKMSRWLSGVRRASKNEINGYKF